MSKFEREERYLVLKYQDIWSGLTTAEQDILFRLSGKIDGWRREKNKEILQAVVIEKDWPEYEPTWQLLEKRVRRDNYIPPAWIADMYKDDTNEGDDMMGASG